MSRLIRLVAFIACMSGAVAVVAAATMDAPGVRSDTTPAPATGATGISPAEPPATPAVAPTVGVGAAIVTGAILIGVGAALAGGGGDEPAAFPSGTGTTGTL